MADPISALGAVGAVSKIGATVLGIGTTVAGGAVDVQKAEAQAAGQKLQIQGQMLQTVGQAFGMEVQAEQYDYQSQINQYQAAVADVNQEIAKRNASYERDVGEVEADQAGMQEHAQLSEMIATQGASGIDVGSPSSASVRESMIEVGKYNQDVIRSSAAKQAYGFDIEATQYDAQAKVLRYTATENEAQATNALTGAGLTRQALPLEQQAMGLTDVAKGLNITGSLISTAGSVASKWLQGSQLGMFNFGSSSSTSSTSTANA